MDNPDILQNLPNAVLLCQQNNQNLGDNPEVDNVQFLWSSPKKLEAFWWQASIVQFLWSTPQKLDNQLQRIAHFLTFEQLHLFLSFFAYQTLPNAVLCQQNNQNLGDQGIFSRFGMS